jgi:hypothetical protein
MTARRSFTYETKKGTPLTDLKWYTIEIVLPFYLLSPS